MGASPLMWPASQQSVIFTALGCGCRARSLIAAARPVPETRFPAGLSQPKGFRDSMGRKSDPGPRARGLPWEALLWSWDPGPLADLLLLEQEYQRDEAQQPASPSPSDDQCLDAAAAHRHPLTALAWGWGGLQCGSLWPPTEFPSGLCPVLASGLVVAPLTLREGH